MFKDWTTSYYFPQEREIILKGMLVRATYLVNTRFHAGIDVQSVTHCGFSLKKIKCPKGELVFSCVESISIDYFLLFPDVR